MSRSRLTLLAVVAALAAVAAMVPASAAARRTTITASGSTSMQKLYIQLAKGYLRSSKRVKRRVRFIEPSGGASDVGIKEGAEGTVDIGLSSRDPKKGDPGVFSKVARDAVCVTTHRTNSISNISQAQVQSIFTGSTSSWNSAKKSLPGVGASGSIDLEVRNSRSGTADAFQNIFLGPNRFVAGSATEHRSAGAQARAIGRNPNAIGYASYVNTRGMHAVPYRGVRCNLRNAKAGRYFGARNFWFVTRGKPKGAEKAFIRWIRRSRAGKRIVGKGFIPLR